MYLINLKVNNHNFKIENFIIDINITDLISHESCLIKWIEIDGSVYCKICLHE